MQVRVAPRRARAECAVPDAAHVVFSAGSRTAGARRADAADPQVRLRRDLRGLNELLGRTLIRQEGAELLELFERVRDLLARDRAAAASLLGELDTAGAAKLARAFATYFLLANVAEQVHRGRELAAIRLERGTWLSQTVDRIAAAQLSRRARSPRTCVASRCGRSSPRTRPRRLAARSSRRRSRSPHCSTSGIARSGRRVVRATRLRASRPAPAGGAGRPAVADRRAARRAARGDRRGPQRRLLLRRAPRGRRPADARGADRRARAARRRVAARCPPADLRHVDRR